MLFRIETGFKLLLFACVASRCFGGTPPRERASKAPRCVRPFQFDSDEEETSPAVSRTPPAPVRRFHNDIGDLGTPMQLPHIQQPGRFTAGSSESENEELCYSRQRMSASSGVDSASSLSSGGQSDSAKTRLFFDDESGVGIDDGGTLVGLESPIGPKLAGGTPTLGLGGNRRALYSGEGLMRHRAKANDPMSPNSPRVQLNPEAAGSKSPQFSYMEYDQYESPPRGGPLGSGPVASLDDLYHQSVGVLSLDASLWSPEDRRYLKAPEPPQAPGRDSSSLMSVAGKAIPQPFMKAVDFGRRHGHKALSEMKWKKTFVTGNSGTVYGVELNGQKMVFKITKHNDHTGVHKDELTQCVEENDIKSLHDSQNAQAACNHKPRNGIIHQAGCSALPGLVPFEYYIAEKAALARGLMPAAASIPHTFATHENVWYLLYEEVPGISPFNTGGNILERLAKPLIREQLKALEKMAKCHIMHRDGHWGNVLYSSERGIQFIDFGIAALVNRFEMSDHKAILLVTFTFDRCLDCAASKTARDFLRLTKHFPVDGHALLAHPWLTY